MSTRVDETVTSQLSNGLLRLTATSGPPTSELCAFATRSNPKRGFLIVSKILGRHLPAAPAAIRGGMDQLGAMLPNDLPEPVVFLGMAETATALGQGVYAAYRRMHPHKTVLYLQTSRQRAVGSHLLCTIEEGHSHATTHLVQIESQHLLRLVSDARSLVLVDDECSTGNTFLNGAEALCQALSKVEQIETCCLTDWSGQKYLASMPYPATSHAILRGTMEWTPLSTSHVPELAPSSNDHGVAPDTGMRCRTGLSSSEAADRPAITVTPGERVLVLGDGEHSYEALLVAEEVEAQGGIAAMQSITRTPANLGNAMNTVTRFTDSYGSGAPCFLYNILSHQPDRIIIVGENEANQVEDAKRGLADLGYSIPVALIHCRYASQSEYFA